MNPSIDLRAYLETKPIESYPQQLINDMRLVSFFPNELATPFGSYIYKMQKYPGDVDLLQEFKECCSEKEVIDKFIKSLKRIVRDILKSKLHYFSEFKAGIDHIYDVDIGYLQNGIYHINPDIMDDTLALHDMGLFDDVELNAVRFVIDKKIFNGDGYDLVYNIYRNRRIIRWTAKEILKGYKLLHGKKKTLFESLSDESHVKIDIIALYNGRFIEITNFVGLTLDKGDGKLVHINIDMSENSDIQKYLPIEIEKLYFSNYYYSPFKMAKRIFSLSRNRKDEETLRIIIPLLSHNVSLMYQIKSELEILVRIFSIVKSPPIKTIAKELDEMKGRITNIVQLNDDTQIFIFEIIDTINRTKDVEKKIEMIDDLINTVFKPLINRLTIGYLQKHGLNPPPSYLLPKEISYRIITRSPSDNPNFGEIMKNY